MMFPRKWRIEVDTVCETIKNETPKKKIKKLRANSS